MQPLDFFDWVLVAIYFFAVFGVAFWAARGEKHTRDSSAGYFLAGRNAGWFVIGASLFASNIGSEHLVGLSGTGATSGVAVGQFEVMAALILLLLGWVFTPFYLKSGVYTMPEFLERRYSAAARWYLALISIVGYVLTKISVTLYAGGIVFEALTGIDFWTGAILIVIATGIYTVFGGLRAVLYTDMLQMFVLIGGAVAVTWIGLEQLGGWDVMQETAAEGMMSMWKPIDDPAFPWTGILIGSPLLGIWYWCTDQFIVQRVLSARNIDQARRGTIFAGYLKLLPLFLFVIPGVVAYGLAKTGQLEFSRADLALPAMVGTLLPSGARGLVFAGLLAALMSSLSSVFNSCSSLVRYDIYQKIHPEASDRQLVWVGQIATIVLVVLGLAWIPLMEGINDQLYTYLQSVQAYVAPPIAAVFLLGIAWPRVNSYGAMTALLTGFVLGMGRLVAELAKDSLGDGLLYTFADINFLHFAAILFAICTVLLIAVSLLTPPEPREKLRNLTFSTVDPAEPGVIETSRAAQTLNIVLTVLLLAAVGGIWIYFS